MIKLTEKGKEFVNEKMCFKTNNIRRIIVEEINYNKFKVLFHLENSVETLAGIKNKSEYEMSLKQMDYLFNYSYLEHLKIVEHANQCHNFEGIV